MGAHLFAHLQWCAQRNLRAATITARRNALRRLEASLGLDPIEATGQQLTDWWATRQHLTAEGRAGELAHVKQFYKWAVIERIITDDPSVRLIRPRVRRGLPRPIAEPDLRVALASAPDRVRPWLFLAAYGGLRAGEIATLRAEDLLQLDDGAAVLVSDGKSPRQRIVPLHDAVVAALGDIPRSGWMFPRRDGQPGHVPPHLVSQLANAHLRSVGVADRFHALRHRFGTQVYRATLDLRVTQDLLGHASPTMTARYAAWTPGAARAAVVALT